MGCKTIQWSNPLYKRKENDTSPLSQADPYMIESDGVYYVYATNEKGVVAYKSENLSDWEYCGIVLTEQGHKEYWAPSVIRLDGTFYMYYSAMPSESDDVHLQAIRVATSDNPIGPFKFAKKLIEPFTIDAHVVKNETGLYMFYCVNDYESVRAGTYIVVDKMNGPLEMEGNPSVAVRPTLDEEIFERDRFKKGQHWHTIEGAFYFEHDGMHYLTYSGSAYTKESYFIGYCTAIGDERDLRKLVFNKMPSDDVYAPLLKKNEFVEGTGHNSIIKIGDNFYIVYHGRSVSEAKTDCDTRTFRMDLLKVEKGLLSCTATNYL